MPLSNLSNPLRECIRQPTFRPSRSGRCGTADCVSEKIDELSSELNLQHLQVWSNFPGVPHDKVVHSVKLFSEEIMPRFADTVSQAAE